MRQVCSIDMLLHFSCQGILISWCPWTTLPIVLPLGTTCLGGVEDLNEAILLNKDALTLHLPEHPDLILVFEQPFSWSCHLVWPPWGSRRPQQVAILWVPQWCDGLQFKPINMISSSTEAPCPQLCAKMGFTRSLNDSIITVIALVISVSPLLSTSNDIYRSHIVHVIGAIGGLQVSPYYLSKKFHPEGGWTYTSR